jgi:very-short-patch-repair endonuclease
MRPDEWIKEFERKSRRKFDSKFERIFVLEVLGRVPNLDFRSLEGQLSFKDSDGNQRYCDFAVKEGKEVRIALEVDGYDKKGRGSGMTHDEFVDWQRREAALVSQGWYVLRFANRDLFNRPDQCAEHVSLLLARERRKAGHLDDLRRSQKILEENVSHAHEATVELKRLQTALASEQDKESRKPEGNSKDNAERIRNLERQVKAAETEIKEKTRLEGELAAIKAQLSMAEQTQPLNEAELVRLDELNEAQKHIEILKEDASTMKTTIWAFTALIGVIILALIFRTPGTPGTTTSPPIVEPVPLTQNQPGPAVPIYKPAPQSVSLGSSCNNPLNWQQASDYIGKQVALSGPVIAVRYGSSVNGKPTWITLGTPYPDRSRLELIIWGSNIDKFPSDLKRRLEGRTVCAYGKVSTYRDTLQIELKQSGQLVSR